jgi:hypothetical protein
MTEHFKFSVRGFSPKRFAYLLVGISAGFYPIHFTGSCEESQGVAGIALGAVLLCLALALFQPRSDKTRFKPAVYALLMLLLHSVSSH